MSVITTLGKPMRRSFILTALLVLAATSAAFADPTALSYTFDWTISTRYSTFDWGSPSVTFTSSQSGIVTGHSLVTVTGSACCGVGGGLTFVWGDSTTSGRASFPYVDSPTDEFGFTTGLDGAPTVRGIFPRNLGFYDPVGDPFAPDSFKLTIAGGLDCTRIPDKSCKYQLSSVFTGEAHRVTSVGASEPLTLAITGIGLLIAAAVRRRRS